MWRRRNDKESIAGFRARSYLRQLELQAYSSLVSALLVQGELTESRKLTLQTLCSQLHISEERHKAEIRRALCDTDLKKASEILRGSDACFLWGLESKHQVPSQPVAVPQNAVVTATRHIVAAAVASQEITAEDVARNSMPRRPPPGHRALFVTKPHERLSVDDLIMGTEAEQATSVKLNSREVIARAVQALYDASSCPVDSSDGGAVATATTANSGNVNLSVTSHTLSSSSPPPLSSLSSSSPPSSAQAPATPGIAITSAAARQLCSLAERLAAAQEAQPVALRALRNEPSPVATRGEASAAAATAAATPRPLPPSAASAAVAALPTESPEKKAPRKKVARRSQSRAAGDDKIGGKAAAAQAAASPVNAPGVPRRPRVPGDGRPKKPGRRPKCMLGDSSMLMPPADAKPSLSALAGLSDIALLPPLAAPGRRGGGVTESTGTLDLLAGMALERNLVAVGGAIGGEGRTTISKTTTSVQVATSGLAGLGDVMPPPAPPPPRFNPVASPAAQAPAVASTTLTLPLPVPGGGGSGSGCTATTQVLSPSLASALPSSAWLTNAISAVVLPATTLLPASGGTAAQQLPSQAAVGGRGATTVVSSTLPTCTATTAVQGRVVHSSSPTPQLGAAPMLHSVAAANASSSSPVTINSSGLPPLFLPTQQQFHVSAALQGSAGAAAGAGDGAQSMPHRSSFSSVTYQSQSLAQLAALAPTTLRTGSLSSSSSSGSAAGAAGGSGSAVTTASDPSAVTVQTGSMQASSATLGTTGGSSCSSAADVVDTAIPSPQSAFGQAAGGASISVPTRQSSTSPEADADASIVSAVPGLPNAVPAHVTAAVQTLPVLAAPVQQSSTGQSVLPAAAAESLILADGYPDYADANGDVDAVSAAAAEAAEAAAENFKQVSSLVAELSGTSDEVAAILQKVESQFVANSSMTPSVVTTATTRGTSILDGIALPDDNQLADFIRMYQASDPNSKIEAVSPSDLASVLSAVVSPNTTAANAASSGIATPSGSAVASSLEEMVAEAAIVDSGHVSSALSAAMAALPGDIDGLVDSDTTTAAAAAASLALALSSNGSPSPIAMTDSTVTVTDSTRLSTAGDDTVLIGESCVGGAGHGDIGDGELLTEIVSNANGLLPAHDVADESCSATVQDGDVVVVAEEGGVQGDGVPLPSDLVAPDAAVADAAASAGGGAADVMATVTTNPQIGDNQLNDAAVVAVADNSPAGAGVAQPASTSTNSVTAAAAAAAATVAAVSSGAPEDVASAAASTAGGNSMSSLPTLPTTGRRKRHSSSEEDSWIRTALGLMQRVNRFRGSNRPKSQFNASAWFLQPVNPKSAPGYLNVIKQPMDFGTIKKKLEQGAYATPMQWLSDMHLVRSNCHLFNSAEHKAVMDCDEVFAFFEIEYDKLKDRWENVADQQPAKRARRD